MSFDISSSMIAPDENSGGMTTKFITTMLRLFVLCLGAISGVLSHGNRHHHHQQQHHHAPLRNLVDASDSLHRCGTREPDSSDHERIQLALGYQQRNRLALQDIVIPVCFHVLIREDNVTGNISDAILQQQLDDLNTAYGATSCCDESLGWCLGLKARNQHCSIKSGFTFAFARMNGSDLVDGETVPSVGPDACITRTVDEFWSRGRNIFDMKSTLHKGNAKVMNVYYQKIASGSLGKAQFPWEYAGQPEQDGVAVLYTTISNGTLLNYNEGDTTVHEAGHWLGLLHTFSGGCRKGDGVADTASEASAFSGCTVQLSNLRNSCSDDDGPDPIFNFMNYGYDQCMYLFTPGQVELMHACYQYFRASGNGSTPEMSIEALELGNPIGPISFLPKMQRIFKVDIQNVKGPIVCRTLGGEGDVDLYGRLDKLPLFHKDSDDCVANSPYANETCTIGPYKETNNVVTVSNSGSMFGSQCGTKHRPCPPPKKSSAVDEASTLFLGVKAPELWSAKVSIQCDNTP